MAGQEVFELPRTRHAHRNSTTGFVVHEPESTNERPGTRRGRRSSVPSNYSGSSSPRYSESDPAQVITPRPPSSRRPKSNFRQNQRTYSQDHDINQREGEVFSGSSGGSRPSTASSLSRYTPLPSIGTKLDLYDSSENDNKNDLADKTKRMTIKDAKESGSRDHKVKGHESESRSQTKARRSSNKDAHHGKKEHKKGNTKSKTEEVNTNNKSGDSNLAEDNSGAIISFNPLKKNIKLPPEPSEKDKRLTLAVKLPDGRRVQRAFKLTNTLQNIMEFAEYTAKLDLKGCQLACNVPVKIYAKLSKTLQECGIEDRTVFHIHVPN